MTPTPSETMSQLMSRHPQALSPVFGFQDAHSLPLRRGTHGYLVKDLDVAVRRARNGADILVAPFPDPIGRDAVQWPGGVNMQLYWHDLPTYAPLQQIPENRIYVSAVKRTRSSRFSALLGRPRRVR